MIPTHLDSCLAGSLSYEKTPSSITSIAFGFCKMINKSSWEPLKDSLSWKMKILITFVITVPGVGTGHFLFYLKEGLISSDYFANLVSFMALNFSIYSNLFIMFWLHIPATIIYAFSNHRFSKYIKYYWVFILLVLALSQIETKSEVTLSNEAVLCIQKYVVKPEDSIWNIMQKYKLSLPELKSMNELDDDFQLIIGQELIVSNCQQGKLIK